MGLLDEQVTLDVADLRAIADAVESLTAVRGSVPAIDVGGYRVELKRRTDQRDGDWYVITSIARIGSAR